MMLNLEISKDLFWWILMQLEIYASSMLKQEFISSSFFDGLLWNFERSAYVCSVFFRATDIDLFPKRRGKR